MQNEKILALVAVLGASLIVGCSSDDSTGSNANDAGPSASKDDDKVGGIAVPSATPVCTGGGRLTVVSGPNASFSWSAVAKATQYGIKIEKSAAGATTSSVVVDRLVPAGPKLEISTDEGEAGAFYLIRGVAFEGTTALCLLDGANGIQK